MIIGLIILFVFIIILVIKIHDNTKKKEYYTVGIDGKYDNYTKYFYIKPISGVIKKIYKITESDDYYLFYGYNIDVDYTTISNPIKYLIKIENNGFMHKRYNPNNIQDSITYTNEDDTYYDKLNDILITNKQDIQLLDRYEYMYMKLCESYTKMLHAHSKVHNPTMKDIGWYNLVYQETFRWCNEYFQEINNIESSNDGSIDVTKFLEK